jgi:hypothetical protein
MTFFPHSAAFFVRVGLPFTSLHGNLSPGTTSSLLRDAENQLSYSEACFVDRSQLLYVFPSNDSAVSQGIVPDTTSRPHPTSTARRLYKLF